MAILLKIRSCYGNATDVQFVVEAYNYGGTSWFPATTLGLAEVVNLGIRKSWAPPKAVQSMWFEWAKAYKAAAGQGIPVDDVVRCKVQVNDVTYEPVDHHDDNNGCRQYQTWRVEDTVCFYNGPDSPVRQELDLELSADLKWGLWSGHRETWEDLGHGLVISTLEHMPEGQTLTVDLAAWEEIRYGRVAITLRKVVGDGVAQWAVDGHMTCGWDEAYDLFSGFGLYDLEDDDDKVLQELGLTLDEAYQEANMERINRRLQELGYHGGANHMEAFVESIPYSMHLSDPGVDNEFTFEFEGTVDQLLQRIDQEEDRLITMSEEEWKCLESCFEDRE